MPRPRSRDRVVCAGRRRPRHVARGHHTNLTRHTAPGRATNCGREPRHPLPPRVGSCYFGNRSRRYADQSFEARVRSPPARASPRLSSASCRLRTWSGVARTSAAAQRQCLWSRITGRVKRLRRQRCLAVLAHQTGEVFLALPLADPDRIRPFQKGQTSAAVLADSVACDVLLPSPHGRRDVIVIGKPKNDFVVNEIFHECTIAVGDGASHYSHTLIQVSKRSVPAPRSFGGKTYPSKCFRCARSSSMARSHSGSWS